MPDEQVAPVLEPPRRAHSLVAGPLLAHAPRSATRLTSSARTVGRTDPAFEFTPVDGSGHDPVVDRRAAVVPCRASMSPVRPGRRRVGGAGGSAPDRPTGRRRPVHRSQLGDAVRLAFEDLAPGMAVPAFALEDRP